MILNIYIYVYLTHVNEQHLYIYQTFFCVFNLFFSSILIYITSSIATSFQCDSVSLVKIYLMGNRGKSFQSSNNRVIQPPELTSHLKTGCGCPMIYTYNIYIYVYKLNGKMKRQSLFHRGVHDCYFGGGVSWPQLENYVVIGSRWIQNLQHFSRNLVSSYQDQVPLTKNKELPCF